MKKKENGWNDNLQPNSYNWNVKFWFKMEIYFRMLHHFISICLASHKKYETQKVKLYSQKNTKKQQHFNTMKRAC
jgi:hypothetical protein